MSNIKVPEGFWAALTAVFAILFILLLLKGVVIAAIVALAAAIWSGLEAAGRGPAMRRQPTRPAP
jgi:hypothetical protein